MGYVIASYGLVLGALLAYGLHLGRERSRLRKALSEGRKAERS